MASKTGKNGTAKKAYLQGLQGMNQEVLEEELRKLYELQRVDSLIDEIRILRGELPLEVQDLEEVVANLKTRIEKQHEESANLEKLISEKKNTGKDAQALIKKYESQQSKVRNNREYDSLGKEIDFQKLEIQLSEKRVKEYKASIIAKEELVGQSEALLKEKNKELKEKKEELDKIVAETEKEEKALLKKSDEAHSNMEPTLLNAYLRIRPNFKNGLAVVTVEREACNGCFVKIPPQRQSDITSHKKLVVCEHCGRILVDKDILDESKKAPTSKVLEKMS
jgi:predicted  nucleic acid-binding Zn-ribbon protein